ncbi:efflux RND transporter periplasmic adaptor subunit [Roseicella frigidaeris]|uniref:Efflux RND transporter periplasmic adaptor subunit n=1 Tax=Roseicella frigidaeris TaxID=2230885 RepID=A0A327MJ72_9PROT|nr:efflux RND transporter periplasmic adaptor subunit [Roseicella frigidaeris]RAI60218.1 efflux RND transporter periplasmic adaptor subunit [Roseicella frigidaeris]
MRHLLLLAPLALAGCKAESAPQPEAERPRPVQVAEVHLAPATEAHAFTGVVRARHEADIAFRAGGRITARLVEVGQKVVAGQPLARIEEADLSLAMRAAEADLSAAEAQARQAAAEASRSKALRAAGHVSIAYDDQRIAAARSAAERAAATRAALDLARRRLDYALLRAPGNGVVTALLAEAGQVVAEGQPVFRLANPEERELVVQVPEAAVARLAAASAAAQFWAHPGLSLPARLRELAPQAETALRTYTARFALPEAPDWIALGMTGTVLTEAPGETLATLPLSALHDRGEGPMVWRVAEGRIAAVPVEVVSLGEVTAALRGALAEGDRVVALGPQLLDPTSRVRIAGLRAAATLR